MNLHDQVVAAFKKVYDPEMPVNIYELGLIYGIDVDAAGQVAIRMTLTAPNCPVAGSLPAEGERAARAVPGGPHSWGHSYDPEGPNYRRIQEGLRPGNAGQHLRARPDLWH